MKDFSLEFPPFDLLLNILGTSREKIRSNLTVQVDLEVLLQLIATAMIGASRQDLQLSDDEHDLLRRYFSGFIPDSFAVDPEFYLRVNPDVAASSSGDTTVYANRHFTEFGVSEGRTPNSAMEPLFVKWMSKKIIDWKWSERENSPLDIVNLDGAKLTAALEEIQLKPEEDGDADHLSIAKAYAAAVVDAPESNRVEVFAWLAGNGQRSALEILLPSVLRVIDAGSIARAAKALDDYSRRSGCFTAERDLLLARFDNAPEVRAFMGGDLNALANHFYRGNAAQIMARYSPESRAPKLRPTVSGYRGSSKIEHVFLGFFGQLRFPEVTLPNLVKQVREAVPNARLSIGLSSWDQVGVRQLVGEDPVGFALTQLPPNFTKICSDEKISLFSEFCDVFPNVGTFLRERAAGQSGISGKTLSEMCGHTIDCELSSDKSYLDVTGATIASEFGAGSFMLNSGRMWNRISGLRAAFDRASQMAGPVTHVILIRPDLQVVGDLRPLFDKISQDETDSLTLVDYDSRAMYLDSVGDRIFICGPRIADRLFDGEAVIQEALRDKEGQTPVYRWFLVPHRFPQTLLYEFGADIRSVPLRDLSVEIYRGQISVQEIKTSIAADILSSKNISASRMLSQMIIDIPN